MLFLPKLPFFESFLSAALTGSAISVPFSLPFTSRALSGLILNKLDGLRPLLEYILSSSASPWKHSPQSDFRLLTATRFPYSNATRTQKRKTRRTMIVIATTSRIFVDEVELGGSKVVEFDVEVKF